MDEKVMLFDWWTDMQGNTVEVLGFVEGGKVFVCDVLTYDEHDLYIEELQELVSRPSNVAGVDDYEEAAR